MAAAILDRPSGAPRAAQDPGWAYAAARGGVRPAQIDTTAHAATALPFAPPRSAAEQPQRATRDEAEREREVRDGALAQEMCYRLMPEFVDVMRDLRAAGFDVRWHNLTIHELPPQTGAAAEPPAQ